MNGLRWEKRFGKLLSWNRHRLAVLKLKRIVEKVGLAAPSRAVGVTTICTSVYGILFDIIGCCSYVILSFEYLYRFNLIKVLFRHVVTSNKI